MTTDWQCGPAVKPTEADWQRLRARLEELAEHVRYAKMYGDISTLLTAYIVDEALGGGSQVDAREYVVAEGIVTTLELFGP